MGIESDKRIFDYRIIEYNSRKTEEIRKAQAHENRIFRVRPNFKAGMKKGNFSPGIRYVTEADMEKEIKSIKLLFYSNFSPVVFCILVLCTADHIKVAVTCFSKGTQKITP